MKRLLLCSIALFYIVLMGDVGFAQPLTENTPNKTITYQGTITSSETGAPLTAIIPVTVVMYKDENGTEKVWEGMYLTDINHGGFQIQLGSGEYPLPPVSELDRGLWVGVSFGGSSEMRPLTPLSASPYALSVADRSISAKKMGTDYVASISVDGKKVTNRGSNLNLISGPGVLLNYDESTNSLVMGSSKGIGGQDPTAANGNPPVPWAELGNNSTNPANDYVGTSDNVPLEFRINGIVGGNSNRVSTAGDGRVMLYDPKANSANIIGGFSSNTANAAEGITIAGGGRNNNINQAFDNFGTIGGGVSNTTGTNNGEPQDEFQVVAGGQSNTASGSHSAITGGNGNSAGGTNSFIGGGSSNSSQNTSTTVAGGNSNNGGGNFSTVGGGTFNTNTFITPTIPPVPLITDSSFIGGGGGNTITDNGGTIGGGRENWAGNDRYNLPLAGFPAPPVTPLINDARYTTVGGGFFNSALEYESAIVGGEDNVTGAIRAFIGAGFENLAYGPASVIGGGEDNQININIVPANPLGYSLNSSRYSVIGGGFRNLITASDLSFIGGGITNTISGFASNAVITGGTSNSVSATNSVIGGGIGNIVTGSESVISGGLSNRIDGSASSIAGGSRLRVGSRTMGFNADVNTQTTDLTTNSFSNVVYFGEADVWIGNVNNTARQLRFYEPNNGDLTYSAANFTSFAAGAQGSNINYVTPLTIGSTGSIMVSSNTTGNTLQMSWLNPGSNGNVLTIVGGIPSWQNIAAGWLLSGNLGTTAWNGTSGNFLGTTDNQPLVLATTSSTAQDIRFFTGANGASERLRITSGGNLQIRTSGGQLQLQGTGSGVTTLSAGGQGATNINYTFPTAAPTANGQLLSSTTSGVLSWVSGSGGGVTGSGTATRVAFWGPGPGSTSNLQDNANLFWDNTNSRLSIRAGTSPSATLHVAGPGGSANSAIFTDGNVGVATTSPAVSMDIDGGLATRVSAPSQVTADNTQITVGNRSYLRISSDGTPANRTITLTDGQMGQHLIIVCSSPSTTGGGTPHGVEILSTSTNNIWGPNTRTLERGDVVVYIFDDVDGAGAEEPRWIEVSFCDNPRVP